MSFKYGTRDRVKDGRAFTDLDETQTRELLNQLDRGTVLKLWINVDKRPDHDEAWLNIVWQNWLRNSHICSFV